jgi:hypothetical protein
MGVGDRASLAFVESSNPLALVRQLLDEQHPGELWSRPLLHLHDVALDGSDAVRPLLLVRKAEAEAQRLVVKLPLTAVRGAAGKL